MRNVSFKRWYQTFGFKTALKLTISRITILKRPLILDFVKDKRGIEIGGPTKAFCSRGELAIYRYAQSIDNVNFSSHNIWNLNSKKDNLFRYCGKIGKEFILEATELKSIDDDSYDFVVSSHMIEHLSNPIKALFEMKRVVKDEGYVIVVAPHKEITFDHNRRITNLQHLIDDYNNDISEGDVSHLDLEEILQNYDYRLDPGVSGKEEFIARVSDNIHNRALHQHVFTTNIILQMLDYVELEIKFVKPGLAYGILAVGKKTLDSASHIKEYNMKYISVDAAWRKQSPFLQDAV